MHSKAEPQHIVTRVLSPVSHSSITDLRHGAQLAELRQRFSGVVDSMCAELTKLQGSVSTAAKVAEELESLGDYCRNCAGGDRDGERWREMSRQIRSLAARFSQQVDQAEKLVARGLRFFDGQRQAPSEVERINYAKHLASIASEAREISTAMEGITRDTSEVRSNLPRPDEP